MNRTPAILTFVLVFVATLAAVMPCACASGSGLPESSTASNSHCGHPSSPASESRRAPAHDCCGGCGVEAMDLHAKLQFSEARFLHERERVPAPEWTAVRAVAVGVTVTPATVPRPGYGSRHAAVATDVLPLYLSLGTLLI